MKKKHIVISGWYGFGNVGDEAILEALMQQLVLKYGPSRFSVLSFKPSYNIKAHQIDTCFQIPIRIISPAMLKFLFLGRFWKTLSTIARCDHFVMGGGGFLSDWQPEVPFGWLKQLRIAKWFGKKTELFGIGAGPYLTTKGKRTIAKYIDTYCDEIWVRDKESYGQLRAAGVKMPIAVDIDPVAKLQLPNLPSSDKILVVLDVVNFKDQALKWDETKSKFEGVFQALKDRGVAFEVVFFQNSPDELAYGQELKEKYQSDFGVKFYEYYQESLMDIAASKAVISVRFHGNVLAYAANKPFLPIIYHHKAAGFLEHIQYQWNDILLELPDGVNWKSPDQTAQDWYLRTSQFVDRLSGLPYEPRNICSKQWSS